MSFEFRKFSEKCKTKEKNILLEHMGSFSDVQATLLQLQARLEILDKLKAEMSNELIDQKLLLENTRKDLDNITEKFCDDVVRFVNVDSIYSEAQKNRQQLTNTNLLQLKEEIIKLDQEMAQWKKAESILITEQPKIKFLEKEIEELHLKKHEFELELKFHKENLKKLTDEKKKVNEYPTKDVQFLKLKETLAIMRESETTNERTYFSPGGSCQ